MGRSGEADGGGRMVKRQVVSVHGPGLEVVSQEKFARRLQGMSGCVSCDKERKSLDGHGRGSASRPHRNRSNNNNSNSGSGGSGSNNHNKNNGKQGRWGKQGRRKQVKAKSPIVIHIKDTLQTSLQQRQRSFDTDSDVSVRSIDEDLYGDVSSIPEFIPQQYMHQAPPPACPLVQNQAASATVHLQSEKSKKNLTALISVIEKAHHKESCHIESNLVGPTSRSTKLCRLLNNEVCVNEKSFTQQQRSIVDCENVDIICNDLHKHGKGVEPVDDTDSVSDKSSVSSGSEAISDSDCLLVEESTGFEFSPEELQRMAEYTTGYPIYRYDCSPAECPQCLSMWYYHQAYQYEECSLDSMWHRSDSQNEEEHDTTLDASDDENEVLELEHRSEYDGWKSSEHRSRNSSTSSVHEHVSEYVSWNGSGHRSRNPSSSSTLSFECTVPRASAAAVQTWATWTPRTRQLWDIGISHSGQHVGQAPHHQSSPYPNSVYLDLTGTDVSISVYYHHSLLQDEDIRASLDTATGGGLGDSRESFPPAHAPMYSLCYEGSPLCGLALPLTLFSDKVVLPKIAMVPPQELKKFTESQLPPRAWIKNEAYTPATRPSAMIKVMCYNVLCDKYCTKQQYGYCPSWALQWDYRKKGLLGHIMDVQADIISLQEVETEQYHNFFKPELGRQGYNGVFLVKSRVKTMSCADERKKVDGCAIFFKKDKFQLMEWKPVEFSQLAMANAEGNNDMLNRVMTKDNVALFALLQTKPGIMSNSTQRQVGPVTPNFLIVATAHIHWDPEYSDVKMVQTMMLMSELVTFVKKVTNDYRPPQPSPGPYHANSIPLVLCGDLNSLPESGVVEFLTEGKVTNNHPDFKDNRYEEVMKKLCKGDKTHIFHDFHLDRACRNIMPFTNYTYDFKGTIDYIFYTRDQLMVVEQLGPYAEEWFRDNKVLGCPNAHIPSDHFSLVVTFEMPFLPTQRNRPTPHRGGQRPR